MKYLKLFEQHNKYNYDKIIRILNKSFGWGLGASLKIEDFENNKDYFQNPKNDDDYVIQFNSYLTDVELGKLISDIGRNSTLRVGDWHRGFHVVRPYPYYNKERLK